jgi:hypothetical protein
MLDDPLEVGTWEDLVRFGHVPTRPSGLDRRDFGKSCFTLGSPTFLDEDLGAAFLVSTAFPF